MNDLAIEMNNRILPDQGVQRVRVRFSGTEESESFQMSVAECLRFHTDWKSYLGGSGPRGGEYYRQEGDNVALMALNFDHIVYTEPGKIY